MVVTYYEWKWISKNQLVPAGWEVLTDVNGRPVEYNDAQLIRYLTGFGKIGEKFPAEKAETDDIETTDAMAAVFGNESIENVRRVPRYEDVKPFLRTGIVVPEARVESEATGYTRKDADEWFGAWLRADNTEVRSAQPPVLALEDSKLLIKITHDNRTVVAEIGDGRWFFAQIVEKLLDPALLAQHQAVEFAAKINRKD
jgi:hypothetical protein